MIRYCVFSLSLLLVAACDSGLGGDAGFYEAGVPADADVTRDSGAVSDASRFPDSAVDSGSGGPDAGMGCTELVVEGSPIRPVRLGGPPPAMVGGPIQDGDYDLVEVRAYDIDLSTFPPRSYRFSDGRFGFAFEGEGSERSGTFVTAAEVLTLVAECPRAESFDVSYTASGAELHLRETVGGGGFSAVKVFRRR